MEQAGIDHACARGLIARDRALDEIIARTRPDELMVTAQVFDHAARLKSFELVAGIRERLAAA